MKYLAPLLKRNYREMKVAWLISTVWYVEIHRLVELSNGEYNNYSGLIRVTRQLLWGELKCFMIFLQLVVKIVRLNSRPNCSASPLTSQRFYPQSETWIALNGSYQANFTR